MHFDDYLGLSHLDLSRTRLVVFSGRSGSGKSTAIEWLLSGHPSFRGRKSALLRRPRFERPPLLPDVVVVDDLTSARELPLVLQLLGARHTVLVASHLAPAWYRPIAAFFPTRLFRTDRDEGKITRRLTRLGVLTSEAAVRGYVRRFGATYTDLDIILERYPNVGFDAALASFTRFCDVELSLSGQSSRRSSPSNV